MPRSIHSKVKPLYLAVKIAIITSTSIFSQMIWAIDEQPDSGQANDQKLPTITITAATNQNSACISSAKHNFPAVNRKN